MSDEGRRQQPSIASQKPGSAPHCPFPGLRPHVWLALACGVLWSVGTALTHVVGIWTGVGGTAIGLGAAALIMARGTIVPLLRPSGRLIAGGLAAAAVMIAVTYTFYPLARDAAAPLSAGVGGLYAILREARLPWVPLLLLPFIIVGEELIWRGVVFEALLGNRLGAGTDPSSLRLAAAVLLSGLAYAAAHAPIGSPLLTVLALVCGLYWSALRAVTDSLVPPLVCHLLWDLLVFVLRPLA